MRKHETCELKELLRLSEETIRFQKKLLQTTSVLLEELNENIYSRLERLSASPHPSRGGEKKMKIIRPLLTLPTGQAGSSKGEEYV